MIPGQVIPGFGEALQQMQEGGRYKIRIPSAAGLWRDRRRRGQDSAQQRPGVRHRGQAGRARRRLMVGPPGAPQPGQSPEGAPEQPFRVNRGCRLSLSLAWRIPPAPVLMVATIGSASNNPRQPEQRAEDQLRGEHQRGREVDRAPRDIGHDEIAIDRLDDEVGSDRPEAGIGPRRESDRDHQQRPTRSRRCWGRRRAGRSAGRARPPSALRRRAASARCRRPSTTMPMIRPNISRRSVKPTLFDNS